eukprot:c11097_g1_i1 orf=62-592(-)
MARMSAFSTISLAWPREWASTPPLIMLTFYSTSCSAGSWALSPSPLDVPLQPKTTFALCHAAFVSLRSAPVPDQLPRMPLELHLPQVPSPGSSIGKYLFKGAGRPTRSPFTNEIYTHFCKGGHLLMYIEHAGAFYFPTSRFCWKSQAHVLKPSAFALTSTGLIFDGWPYPSNLKFY